MIKEKLFDLLYDYLTKEKELKLYEDSYSIFAEKNGLFVSSSGNRKLNRDSFKWRLSPDPCIPACLELLFGTHQIGADFLFYLINQKGIDKKTTFNIIPILYQDLKISHLVYDILDASEGGTNTVLNDLKLFPPSILKPQIVPFDELHHYLKNIKQIDNEQLSDFYFELFKSHKKYILTDKQKSTISQIFLKDFNHK